MLSTFDDYPIHQTPDPIAMPATGEKDFYERYWFNGYDKSGTFYLGIGAALYPHLGIQDCGISVVREGVQYAFHASARADESRAMRVGPFELDIVEPMKSCRVTLDDNETGFSCDLLFEARTSAIEEPRHHLVTGIRRLMDTTRFTQFGRWKGWVRFDGEELPVDQDETWGTKDRSWGVRPIGGGDVRGAPAAPRPGGIFFLWAPCHFEDLCAHYQLFDDHLGRPLFQVGAFLPTYPTDELPGVEDPAVEPCRSLEHDLRFAPGSRMIAGGSLAMTAVEDGRRHRIDFEKVFTHRMKGLGYGHPEWGHGLWKGELAMAAERWNLADVDDTAYENQHVQHLIRVTIGERVGIGVLEQHALGPYQPYGFEGLV